MSLQIAGAPGLQSLVLFNNHYSEIEMVAFGAVGPEIVLS